MDLLNTYFFTATILEWNHLLKSDRMKNIVLESLQFLVVARKLKIYGFVIMPNHIHLIIQNLEVNGKEFPVGSLLKFTSHLFKKELLRSNFSLEQFRVDKIDRKYQFWQRNSLPILIFSREMLEQKLSYIHSNPLQNQWMLASDPNDYFYSSCSFYEQGDLRFPWLVDYREDF
jgi:putative transposase